MKVLQSAVLVLLAGSGLLIGCGPSDKGEPQPQMTLQQMTEQGQPLRVAATTVSDGEVQPEWWWTPGKVNWHWNLAECGDGYRVRPEGGGIVCAKAPSQEIDGIYKLIWGCDTVLKVPNDCVADVYQDGAIWCTCYSGGGCTWESVSALGWSPPC